MRSIFPITLLLSLAFAIPASAETLLFDASKPETPGTTITVNQIATETKDGLLILTNRTRTDWPGITLRGNWAFGINEVLVLELENKGTNTARVSCRLDSPNANPDTGQRTFTTSTELAVGEMKRWEVAPPHRLPPQLQERLFGMRGYPGGVQGGTDGRVGLSSFDPTDLVAVFVFYARPSEEHSVGIKRMYIGEAQQGGAQIASRNEALNLPPEQFFPMIDKYGQYIHADWLGKIKSDDDLKKNWEAEEKALAAAPTMPDRSQYGGWTKGPQLEATGHFYATKRNGVWWLVDPEGYLFWSHGADCVRTTNAETPTSDREHLFAELPFADFKGRGSWAVHGYYVGKTPYDTYNFTMSNLRLKYGEDWRRIANEIAHKRLHAWGMNTIANWSESQIYNLRKTPYTATLNSSGPVIVGSEGYWGQFRDPFHPDFRRNMATTMSRQQALADDPWCIGIFVDNELGWGNETSLAVAALASPATQPAKIAVVDMLRKKYETIEHLNGAWQTAHADWNALLNYTTTPNTRIAYVTADLREGYTLIAEEYHRVIREELKRVAPNTIYFGCRFAWVNDRAVRAADKYCDVLSFNLYQTELSGFRLPEGVDKAVIIGEFHFGALDRGMLHTGLCPTPNQQARAAAYERYVRSGVEHPNIVGTHWFQYGDQATTGRGGDGENYQIGLVDVCDTPYPETIDAVKRIGGTMYDLRLGRESANANRAAAQIQGTITLDGTPVERATVTFHPIAPNGEAIIALTNVQGQFTMRAMPGDYRVSVSKRVDSDSPNVTVEVLPTMYVHPQTTPLQATVERGRNIWQFDLSSR
ncbi:MAG: carboxypeptidase-like regulatory domain-containing protein [Planctomycetaceae bacterium]|nr:carboxypeptidase-like regulatory domain-containing protein [Planctomycetaceae bacterium]